MDNNIMRRQLLIGKVSKMLKAGKTDKEISEKLTLSISTIMSFKEIIQKADEKRKM